MPRVAVVPGEGAAPEAIHATVSVLDAMGLGIVWSWPEVGRAAQERFGTTFPDASRAALDAADATLFGATSGPSALALFHLRWGRRTYANVRPIRFLPGARSPLATPDGIDFAIVRENLEDLYLGVEGDVAALAPLGLRSPTAGRAVAELAPGRFALKVITEEGTRRVARAAFALARRRAERRGRPAVVTSGTKHNLLRQTDGLFLEVTRAVAAEHPDVVFEPFIVDDLARRLVATPHALDVVLLPNLYGDVLSDAAAGLVGGLGLAPSGCYGDDYAYFEPSHGTADDIAGRGIVNPTATLLSAAMMLEHLRLTDAARALERAVAAVYAEGRSLTPDQGGNATTKAFCAAVTRHAGA